MGWIAWPPIAASVVLATLLVAAEVGAVWKGQRTLAAAGLSELLPGTQYAIKANLTVPPEPFHMRKLQSLGRIRNVDGQRISLSAVSDENLRALSRAFWIANVELDER